MISIGNLQINKLCLGDVAVSKAYLGDVEVYGLKPEGKYMTITVLDGEAGTTISPTVIGTLSPNLQYRVNNGSWNDFIVGTTADIHVVAGDVVQFKGVNESGISTSDKNYMKFSISGNPVSLSGNVMSLIDGVGETLVIPRDYCFYRLFHGSSIKTVSPDFLPATTLTNGCYFDLFSNSILENAPELPALTMQENCYRGMFYGCQKFTQAPILPATTLAIGCYAFMLSNCSSLVQAPELHATTIAQECYRGMFQNCTALTQANELPAKTLTEKCYDSMFAHCTKLTQAPVLPATELSQYCYNQMFWDCTSLTQAPELPATTLADYCYQYMFYGCSKLNYVKSLAINITATNALNGWLSGVASTGTFVKPIGVGYPTGASGIPNGWTIEEIDAPTPPEPKGKYMTMTVLDGDAGTTIAPTITGSLSNLNLQYRINNNGDWTNFIVGTTADIHAVAGDVVQFKGVNVNGISWSTTDYLNFAISGNPVALSGNIMSLIDGVGETLVIPNEYCFTRLFSNSNVKTVSKDFLPATKLTMCCYTAMFWNCSNLVQAPALPATTLAYGCYQTMFKGCTSLVQAPALPATTLEVYCYNGMFENCTSLVQAPELPATTLVMECYRFMFNGCTKLNYVKSLATTGIINEFGRVSSSIEYWLDNVSPTGTFVKPRGVSYPSGGIPSGWTIEEI